ncbi:putative hydrolase [Alloactinosynnema sp. L-07]|uniref:HAD family hydrolase n=1 Tax=Alloactinosynnema sp. L-07 TaxID=1653480 RepID=UPI00065EFD78|nr:HAD-IA family hydrolase [Alloactinosynnema sp. L-07]CRK61173.1 putative hydrolase [Alloactinosynnema sp. L-07]
MRGVLLDFSGTLFRLELGAAWVRGLTNADGTPVTEAQQAQLLAVFTAGPSKHLPAEFRADWHRRDLDADTHRTVYLAAMRAAGMDIGPGVAETLYDRVQHPDSWQPYPDTVAALTALRAAGIPVAVVSNIAWEIEPVFAHHGAADLVDTYVLSFVEGVMKPDAKIFQTACERIGVAPEHALMIGDDLSADAGATALGCRFERVEPQATQVRHDALLTALRTHGLAA